MKTWIYSDPHFGHGRIIGYCNRPWWRVAEDEDLAPGSHLKKVARVGGGRGGDGSTCWYEVPDVAAMEEALVENWNARVSDGDTVYCLGDFAWWHLSVAYVVRIRARLNGTILMVRGNHDVNRQKVLTPAMREVFGEDDVLHARLVELEGRRLLLYHYGVGSWGRSMKARAKHRRRLEKVTGGVAPDLFLHGHSHSAGGVITEPLSWEGDLPGDYVSIPAVDMSVEGWDYAPASLDEILARVSLA